MTTCGKCGTVWHGLTECHCASCHAFPGRILGVSFVVRYYAAEVRAELEGQAMSA